MWHREHAWPSMAVEQLQDDNQHTLSDNITFRHVCLVSEANGGAFQISDKVDGVSLAVDRKAGCGDDRADKPADKQAA